MKKNHTRVIFYGLLVLLVMFIFLAERMGIKEQKLSSYNFDTMCDITAYTRWYKPLENAESIIKKYDDMWSPDREDSELYKINNNLSQDLSPETRRIIEIAESFKREDLFNIYVDSLVKAWDIKNNTGTIPDVEAALGDMKAKKGINLGGIAKGYVTDKIADSLREDGVDSALISLGGNVYAMGKKPTGESWRIGIADPKDPDKIIGSIRAENLSVVTSGDYQRYFELDGKKYHHIFDPRTGFPADNGLISVTIVGESSVMCDALSTMIFVAGLEEGKELLKEYNVGGILVTEDTVYFSKSLENIFKQNNFDYKYEFIL
ncbi:MAG: FAD:protein FMN transferase [Ruminococcaceae bacterium]|nr:FAD:protein FMN transferase [Oscillospiraceae bacterium]